MWNPLAGVFCFAVVASGCGARSGVEWAPPATMRADGGLRDARSPERDAAELDAPEAGADAAPEAGADAAPPTCAGPAEWVAWDGPTDAGLNDVVVAGDEAWITGNDGTLLRWDGADWRREDVPTSADLRAIWVDGRGAGWIITDGGLLTLDGGRWRAHPRPALPESTILSAVWGRSPIDVWFGGGAVTPRIGLHFHWDGATITRLDDAPTGVQVTDMRGDAGIGLWSVSQGSGIARLRAGAWERLPDPPGSTATSVWARSEDDAWFSAAGEAHHWSAGVWERHRVTARVPVYYYTIWASSDADVWVAGSEGAAGHFDGAAWSEVALPVTQAMVAIDGRCATDAWMVGGGGTILRLVPRP